MEVTRSWLKPLAAIICCGLMAVHGVTLSQQEARAQTNNPPVFNTPSATEGSYVFPGFAAVSITFAGDPVTDQENDDITYSYRAILPGINSDASLAEALLEAIKTPKGFSFQRKTGYTTQQYIDVYGTARTTT